jgi:hypothetical protein
MGGLIAAIHNLLFGRWSNSVVIFVQFSRKNKTLLLTLGLVWDSQLSGGGESGEMGHSRVRAAV